SQPNGANGISITGGLRALIGGPSTAARNVISGNGGSGISISAPLADVQGNMIGTNRPGAAGLGNGSDGVRISSPNGADIGGTAPKFRNVISGNNANGIEIVGNGNAGFANAVVGNVIGLGANGSTKIANSSAGVLIGPGAVGTDIGSTQLGAG